MKNNKFKLSVTCDDTEPCEGKIVVRTTRKVKVGEKPARKVLVAKKAYSGRRHDGQGRAQGQEPARSVLAQGRVKVKAVQSAPGADRAVDEFWLRSK